jgi:hypothetical protein
LNDLRRLAVEDEAERHGGRVYSACPIGWNKRHAAIAMWEIGERVTFAVAVSLCC